MVETAAWADWPHSTRVAQSSGTAGPTAVAVRNWAPSGNVYIVVETGNTSGNGSTTASLYRYLCYGGASCTPALHPVGTWPMTVGGTVGRLTSLHTAMAIDANAQHVEAVDIIRRDKVDLDCDDDLNTSEAAEEALDLRNYQYLTNTNAVATGKLVSTNLGNSTNNDCSDTGVSQLKRGAGALNACYTFKINPQVFGDDRLVCNDDGGNPTFVWWNDVHLTSSAVEDHPAFDFKDGERVVVGGRRPAGSNNDEIRFHFPDAGGAPEPNFAMLLGGEFTDDGILPDVMTTALAGGGAVTYAVWEADEHKEIRVGRCPASDDCQQSGDWTVTTPLTTVNGLLQHPEIASDGAFQILVWEEDDDAIAGGERIYAMTRCGGTAAWGSPELLRTADLARESQSILIANPHVVLNRADNVAHVVFVELDTLTTTSETWWVRTDYTDCP